jgi:cobalamin biosynthetic protein CobC
VPVDALEAGADRFDVLILSHPNNPTGRSFQVDTLLGWHARLAARGGWLVVDEAFMDCSPALSLASHARQQGLIVLRSLGKFFGLAGARLGFALAAPDLLARLQAWLGPWAVSAPARHVGCLALQDREWQAHARAQLPQDSQRLATLLTEYRLPPKGGTALFQWVVTTEAGRLHVNLARRGILTRLFNEPTSLRIGLPRAARDWQRLEEALAAVCG